MIEIIKKFSEKIRVKLAKRNAYKDILKGAPSNLGGQQVVALYKSRLKDLEKYKKQSM